VELNEFAAAVPWANLLTGVKVLLPSALAMKTTFSTPLILPEAYISSPFVTAMVLPMFPIPPLRNNIFCAIFVLLFES
jgi:hypothetical protein